MMERSAQLAYVNRDINSIIKVCYEMMKNKMDKYLSGYDNTTDYNTFTDRVELVMKKVTFLSQDNCSDSLKEKFEEVVNKYLTEYDNTTEFNQHVNRILTILENSSSTGFLKNKTLCFHPNEDNFVKIQTFKEIYDMFNSYKDDFNKKLLSQYDTMTEFKNKMARLERCMATLEKFKLSNWGYAIYEKELLKSGALKYTNNADYTLIGEDENKSSEINVNSTNSSSLNHYSSKASSINMNHHDNHMGFFKKLIIAFKFLLGGDLSALLPKENYEALEVIVEDKTIKVGVNQIQQSMVEQLKELYNQSSLSNTNKALLTQIIDEVNKLSLDEENNVAEFLEVKNTCMSVLPHLFSIFENTKNKENQNNDGKNAHDFLSESLEAILNYLKTTSQNMQHAELNDIEVYSSFVKNKFVSSSI